MAPPSTFDSWQWTQRFVWLVLLLSLGGLFVFHEPARHEVSALMGILKSLEAKQLQEYLLGFGGWAAGISAGLMVMQAIVAPLPAFVITIANGLMFGWLWGGLLSLISATIAAQLCFEISRSLGRPFMERAVGQQPLAKADALMTRYGMSAIVIGRLLPMMPFDPLSYAAGLTFISRKRFIAANLVGQLPATGIYAYFGDQLQYGLPWPVLFTLFFLAFGVLVITYGLHRYSK